MTKRSFARLAVLLVGLLSSAAMAGAQEAAAKALPIGPLQFHMPTVAVPYYHVTVDLDIANHEELFVGELLVNGAVERNYLLADKDHPLPPDQPRNERRLTIAEALKSIRPDHFYTKPTLYVRADWRAGESVTLRATVHLGGKKGEAHTGEVSATAPPKGGYWNPAWKHYQSVVLSETAGHPRVAEPVQVTMLVYPDTLSDPNREIRVVHFDPKSGLHHEVPSQIIDHDKSIAEEAPMYDEHGKQKPATFLPTDAVTVMFSANVAARGSAVYLVFHGNPEAPAPQYASDLQVSGEGPGVTVANSTYAFKMHPLNGMLDEVVLKAKPELKFEHKKETNGAIQWNPDVYSPPRAWVHISDWEPGKYDYDFEESRGPVVYRTRLWGQMPLMPEVTTSMEYEFYAGVPYFRMRSSMHIRHEVAVQALRNSEVVFAREAFSEAAWFDAEHNKIETRNITAAPDLSEWTMADTTPWIAFFDREKGCGYGGIQVNYMNGGLNGELRTLNPFMYVTTGPWIYWTRALAYPYGGRNPQQLVNIPEGSVFLEEWAYLPFELGKTDKNRFDAMAQWQARLTNPLLLHLEAPIDPRMQIPEEIYIEPTKTGWGDDAGYHKE